MHAGRIRTAFVAAAVALTVALTVAPSTMARRHRACASPNVSAPRDPANPLALPTKPASDDPLEGAHFFVDGPKHGQAAGAVAKLIHLNAKASPVNESWAVFKARHAAAINANPQARQLAKIADQEETQNVSQFSEGGGPGRIYGQTHKLLCTNMLSDRTPATVMVFSTYFIYPHGQACPDFGTLNSWQGAFHRYVNEMARAIHRRRAVIFEEIDSIVLSSCEHGAALRLWLGDLSYESKVFSGLTHAVVYEEGGYSDARAPGWTADRLWQAGVRQVRGFFTNDTHFVWSSYEIAWARKVARFLTAKSHGKYNAHFVVNTAQNGHGPLANPHPTTQGNENLCNPPGRGIGRIPTGNVHPIFGQLNDPSLDGFMWTGVPGRSHNSNCPGGPWKPAGVFDPRFALELAQGANQQLGPDYPSEPY